LGGAALQRSGKGFILIAPLGAEVASSATEKLFPHPTRETAAPIAIMWSDDFSSRFPEANRPPLGQSAFDSATFNSA
jgi:hypothetical protein